METNALHCSDAPAFWALWVLGTGNWTRIIRVQKYRAVFTSRSAVKLEKQRVWMARDYSVSVQDATQPGKGESPDGFRGLTFTVTINQCDIYKAIAVGSSIVRSISDQLSFTHGAWIADPLAKFAVDVGDERKDRELLQVFSNVVPIQQPLRAHEAACYRAVLDAIDKAQAERPDDARHMLRALRHLRHSLLEQDPIDRFQDAWLALAAVSTPIAGQYKLCDRLPVTCPRCKEQVLCASCNEPISSLYSPAIDHLLRSACDGSESVAAETRRFRNALEHGSVKKVEKAMPSIGKYTNLARRAAVEGVLDALGIPKEHRTTIEQQALLAGTSQLFVRAHLLDAPVEALARATGCPQLVLHQPMEAAYRYPRSGYAGEDQPLALNIFFGIRNYDGQWELSDYRWPLVSGSTASPQVFLWQM